MKKGFNFLLKDKRNVYIREALPEDAGDMINYISYIGGESDYLTFGPGEFSISEEKEAAILKAAAQANNSIFLLARADKKLVGCLNFSGGAKRRIRHTGEFGVSVRKEFWRLGIATYLIKVMMKWAYESGIIRKINLRVRSDNQSAIKLYKRLGFIQEGFITREFYIDGNFYDAVQMGILVDPLV